ncbi:MAG: GxxExxY protein, partial [Pedobacter sp.]
MTKNYNPTDFPLRKQCLAIVEIAFNIHKTLGGGLANSVYKSAFENALDAKGIEYLQDMRYAVNFNGMMLEHKFYPDFLVYGAIIVEIKSAPFAITDTDLELFNQLIVTKPKIGLII